MVLVIRASVLLMRQRPFRLIFFFVYSCKKINVLGLKKNSKRAIGEDVCTVKRTVVLFGTPGLVGDNQTVFSLARPTFPA